MKDVSSLNVDIFHIFNKDWALLTAGDINAYNAMTISWGQLGSLWGGPGQAKNIITVFVKPIRYTFNFMEKSTLFTVSWFTKDFHKDLTLLGSKSGRDGNKLALTKLTPKAFKEGGVGYEQATRTLICKKIYSEQLKKERIPADVADIFYTDEEPHYLYIGEILHLDEQN